jgi:hypothetical protein
MPRTTCQTIAIVQSTHPHVGGIAAFVIDLGIDFIRDTSSFFVSSSSTSYPHIVWCRYILARD